MPPPILRFSLKESLAAQESWGANCGPHSLAAACGVSLEEVRAALPNFRGWMNPTMIGKTLKTLGRTYSLRKGLKTLDLCQGINRLQWEGPWLERGVPAKAAYRHTHYVACKGDWVLCSAISPADWIPKDWLKKIHFANGEPYHITHHYQLHQLP